MYTDENENLYEDGDYEELSRWDNNKGLIFKIIIIVLCIIVLIWLIKALKSNRNQSNNGDAYIANVEKVRLAAEDYFFIKNKKDDVKSISIAGLQDAGLINDVIDDNNKVCNAHNSIVNLDDEIDTYTMTISLSCSTENKDQVFYYHKNTLACLNCKGKTNMTGEVVVANKDENKDNNGGNNNVNNDISDDNDESNYYSCVDWSDWTKTRVHDSSLTERSKTLVQGVKYGKTTTYGEWSEYSTIPIVGSESIEIETKTLTEDVWSENKTSTSIDASNPKVRIVSTDTIHSSDSKCENGNIVDGKCYSNNTKIGNLTMAEYNSGKYNIKNGRCEKVSTLKNSEGKYVLTYVNCEYSELIDSKNQSSSSYTIYTYQELESKSVTYYRYRTITTVDEPDEYTKEKYEEKFLPEGYVKVDGSEETYYSYKLTTCVK